jgi:hypothetical protein
MKFLKSSWLVWLALVVGFAIGAIVFYRTPSVQAQSRTVVTIQQILSPQASSRVTTDGSQVVGFSCAQVEERIDCYVASVR